MENRIGIIVCSVIFLFCVQSCSGQNDKQRSLLKKADLEDDVPAGSRETTIPATDYQVLDGLYVTSADDVAISKANASTVMKDPVELKQMGLKYPDKTYTFYNSDVDGKYRKILEMVKIPEALYGQNLPLIVNSKIIAVTDSQHIERLSLDKIKTVSFKNSSSAELSKFPNIALGAVYIVY